MPRKVVIDVDTGIDDAQAIMLALSCPDIDVLAITCVAGNVDISKVCLNTLKVLTVCHRLDVSVLFSMIQRCKTTSNDILCVFASPLGSDI